MRPHRCHRSFAQLRWAWKRPTSWPLTVSISQCNRHSGRDHPLTVGMLIDGIRHVNLVWLVQLKLAMRPYRNLGDVASLIRAHNLDESFLRNPHPSVHQDFIECLEEKRRDDEYDAQE